MQQCPWSWSGPCLFHSQLALHNVAQHGDCFNLHFGPLSQTSPWEMYTLHILTQIPHVCAHTPAHTHLHTHIFTHTHTFANIMHACARTYTHMYACTHKWRCRHTNWPFLSICVCATLLLVSETYVYIDGSPLSLICIFYHTHYPYPGQSCHLECCPSRFVFTEVCNTHTEFCDAKPKH